MGGDERRGEIGGETWRDKREAECLTASVWKIRDFCCVAEVQSNYTHGCDWVVIYCDTTSSVLVFKV